MSDLRRRQRKTLACLITWLLALTGAPATWAQVSPSCEILLSTAQIDYGRLSRATLPEAAHGWLDLPARTVGMQVRCPEPQDMTVVFRSASAGGDAYRFMDGGRFTLRMRDARLDGQSVDLGLVDRETGVAARTGRALPWGPAQGLAPVRNGRAAAGTEFSASIDLVVQVDDSALSAADAARWTATGSVDVASTDASRELRLQADVQPGRCDVAVLRQISFGRLRSTDLDRRGASTRLVASQRGRLQVICDGPMPFAFRIMRDERAGTAVGPVGLDASYAETQLFGLGKTPAGQNIGAYVLQWSASATSDRGDVSTTRSLDGGRSWTPVNGVVVADRDRAERVGYASIEAARAGPSSLKVLDVALDAILFIAPASSLSLDDEVAADGLMTIEIVY